jgi:predicted porin
LKQKTILRATVALWPWLAGCACAQDSVTLYGVADVFVELGRAGTVAAPTRILRLQSGGLNGSRLGFRGSEHLGDGLKGEFVLEHGLLLDTGAQASAAAFWNRQAFVGLSGPWGQVSAGRQYTPLLVHQDSFDAALSTTGYGSGYNSGVMRSFARANNSVLYRTPAAGAWSAAAMASLGEAAAGTRYGSLLSTSLRYSDGPLALGAGFGRLNKPDTTRENKSIWNVAGSYKFAQLQLMAALQGTKNDSQNAQTLDDRREFMLGATYALGPGQIRASFAQGRVAEVDRSTARHLSLGYLHSLSKRTALFAAVQSVKNPDNLAYRSGGFTFDAIDGGLSAGAGVDARALALGMRHRF